MSERIQSTFSKRLEAFVYDRTGLRKFAVGVGRFRHHIRKIIAEGSSGYNFKVEETTRINSYLLNGPRTHNWIEWKLVSKGPRQKTT